MAELGRHPEKLLRLIEQLQAEKPAPAAAGRLRWLKQLLYKAMDRFVRPQTEFNRDVLACLRLLRDVSGKVRDMEVQVEGLQKRLQEMDRLVRPAEDSIHAAAGESTEGDKGLLRAIEKGFFLRNVSPGKFNVLDEMDNWDVLVLLDACRHDAFERVHRQDKLLDGVLSQRISCGSHTTTWFKNTFDRPCPEIVYLSTNPHISARYLPRLGVSPDTFAHLEELWHTRWDANEHTVMPQAVAEEYLRLRERFPDRKFILHFMQPHSPFVGKTRLRKTPRTPEVASAQEDGTPRALPSDLTLVQEKVVTLREAIQAYDDNIRVALDVVAAMLPRISGHVAITSDHGELLSEYGMFGHFVDLWVPELIEVPWFLVQK